MWFCAMLSRYRKNVQFFRFERQKLCLHKTATLITIQALPKYAFPKIDLQ